MEEAVKKETKRLVGIRFSLAGKMHTYHADDVELSMHDLAVVEGTKGNIIGEVVYPPYEENSERVPTNIKKVLKKADSDETEKFLNNREEAMAAFERCQKKITEHGLSMKLVDVVISVEDNKATFYFTAEERVDFRALVKDLANCLHKRIEMRQIGARDAAKCIGAIGSCGLTCCCSTFLPEFKSISIQMAKNQGLSPNPAKLTGICGKLKCCMIYENETYNKTKKNLPTVGSEVETPQGAGVINNLDVPRELCYVYVPEQEKEIRFSASEIKVTKARQARKKKPNKKNSKNNSNEEAKKSKKRNPRKGKDKKK